MGRLKCSSVVWNTNGVKEWSNFSITSSKRILSRKVKSI
nr:MAG TPA: hypothetical protein [Microviridae sp.]